jgi:hypothetical protein
MKYFPFKISFFLAIILVGIAYMGNAQHVHADGCTVSNAKFRTNAGNDPDNFYNDLNRPYIYVDVYTSGCQGSTLEFSITQTMGDLDWDRDISIADNIPIQVNAQTTDSFTLQFIAGENWCGLSFAGIQSFLQVLSLGMLPSAELGNYSIPNIWDCGYHIEIIANGVTHSFAQIPADSSMHLDNQGQLSYNCQGSSPSCNVSWSSVTPLIIPIGTSNDLDQFNVTPPDFTPLPPDNSYLAPLPGLNQSSQSSLGGFLKSLFTVLIIIAGLLAFLMIVLGAITYLSSEGFGEKSHGKEMMVNAVLGLILALGAWLILNAINPNLASNLSITVPKVSLDVPRTEWMNGNAPAGTNIAHNITLNGQPILQGAPWPDDTIQRNQLAAAGISVTASNPDPIQSHCPTAGTPGCTSVYFESGVSSVIQQIIDFKTACNCDIVITGGSEAWLHQTHGPNVKVVDMRATETLNGYLNTQNGSSGTNFPTGRWITVNGVGKFWAEPSHGSQNATEHHWHVIFN